MGLLAASLAASLVAGGAAAEVRQWTLGEEGEPWAPQVQTSAALRIPADTGPIHLLSFSPQANIVEQLTWTADGTPQDYLTPLPNGRAWDNLALRNRAATLAMVDGDSTTSTHERFKETNTTIARTSLFFDLGTRFPVSRFSFFPRQSGFDREGRPYIDDFLRSFEIQVQDGLRFDDSDLPIYGTPPLRVVEATTLSIADIPFPLQFVRYIRLRVTSNTPFEIAEFQAFGRGFSPVGELLSQVVDLQRDANFDRLSLVAHGLRMDDDGTVSRVDDADAEVTVRMRTGSTPDPLIYYRLNQGTGERQQVSAEQYRQLEPFERGEPEDDQSRWSLWSSPMSGADERIDLPSPRRYFQLQVRVASHNILDGAGIDALSVSYATPPLAQEVVAEISIEGEPEPPGGQPVAPTGVYSTFVYDVRASVRQADSGFDGIEIRTPGRPVFERLERGQPSWRDLAPALTDSVAETDSSLVVYFAPVESAQYLRVLFRAQVFSQATRFGAQVVRRAGDEPAQKVLPGDAHPGVQTLEASALRVLTSAASARVLLPTLTVTPRVLTPNGDDINDAAAVAYTLTQLLEPVPVTIDVQDLSGRRLRRERAQQGNGVHTWMWDGRDGDGQLLPVGTYVVRVSLHADRKRTERVAVVALAY